MDAPLIRSFLIAPANRASLVMKFSRFNADLSVIDLEDGTPEREKENARAGLPDLIKNLRAAGFAGLLGVRVNEPWSAHYLADIEAIAPLALDVLALPKLENPDQLFPAVHALRRAEANSPRKRSILAGIETVTGVVRCEKIFGAYPEISCAYFGAEDFLADIGGLRTRTSNEVQTERGANSARAGGVACKTRRSRRHRPAHRRCARRRSVPRRCYASPRDGI
jgi:citrate lyase subunit beta/citryl-CoA lyase